MNITWMKELKGNDCRSVLLKRRVIAGTRRETEVIDIWLRIHLTSPQKADGKWVAKESW